VNIGNDFHGRTQFPNCVGAVDGNTFELKCHLEVGLCFITTNTSQFYSGLILDAYYCFIAVAVVATGSTGNPRHMPLPNDNAKYMPFVIVGDEAFAWSEHVLRPYQNRNLSVQQRIHNYGLTRARRMVERAFGYSGK